MNLYKVRFRRPRSFTGTRYWATAVVAAECPLGAESLFAGEAITAFTAIEIGTYTGAEAIPHVIACEGVPCRART